MALAGSLIINTETTPYTVPNCLNISDLLLTLRVSHICLSTHPLLSSILSRHPYFAGFVGVFAPTPAGEVVATSFWWPRTRSVRNDRWDVVILAGGGDAEFGVAADEEGSLGTCGVEEGSVAQQMSSRLSQCSAHWWGR
jgi:hypothetical protein